ncbi:MAG TPA: hypothetical protein VIC54_00260 [Terriglobales bacterium]
MTSSGHRATKSRRYILMAALAAGAALLAAGQAPGSPAAAGAALFSGQTPLHNGGPPCTVCHSAPQLGMANRGTIGPDLSSVYAALGAAGLNDILSAHLPASMAPIYGPHALTAEEQNAIIAFLSAGKAAAPAAPNHAPAAAPGQSPPAAAPPAPAPAAPTSGRARPPKPAAAAKAPAATAPTPPPPPAPPSPALIALGEQLFSGQVRFQNGGPACIACHSAAGNRFPNGGGLGPDLTTIDTRIGPFGVDATLQTLFFPAMRPLYHGHQLTPQEQAALAAYFQSIAARPPQRATAAIAAWAFITFLILLAITAVLGRRHTAGVRRRLVEAARHAPRRADLVAAATRPEAAHKGAK